MLDKNWLNHRYEIGCLAMDIRPCCGRLTSIRHERCVVSSSPQGFQIDLDPTVKIETMLGHRGDLLGGTGNQVGS